MPIYAYKCDACGVEKELIKKYEEKEVPCECEGGLLKRQLSFNSVALGLPNGHFAIRSKSRKEEPK